MRIAIIGAGNVGGGLGTALAATGHSIVFGVRDEAKRVARELARELGFDAQDAGGLVNAKPLEAMVKVWLALTATHGRTVAFSISTG